MDLDRQNPLVVGFFDAFKIPTRLTVTEWADAYRMLPSKGAAAPGRYRSSRTPYMRAPMDDLSATSPVEEIILMAAAQTGKSESGNNWVGYVVDNAPGPMLLVQPTVDNAKRYSKQRITPMIMETPSLAAKIVSNTSRDSGNTMLEKEFPGGILLLGGANSAAGLRSMPVRYLFADEISNWPADVDGEGDPLELAEARTTTFGRKRKVFKCSTPSIKGVCRVEAEYLKSDQRKFFVPCPECGHMHVLEFANFIIPTDENGRKLPSKSYMVCPENGCVIHEHRKTEMLTAGEWRVTCPENADNTRRGYHISALYSPIGWKSWEKIAKQWIEAQGKPTKLQAFINNVLAETWKETGESIDEHALMERAEDYGTDPLPPEVLVLSTGVDVQPDRLEVELVGWGLGEESWSLDHHVIRGDPNGPLVWQLLDMYLMKEYQHPCGVRLRTARTFVDTGGSNTKAVYDYVESRSEFSIFGIKGRGGDGIPPVGTPSKSNLSKIPLVPLGTFALKDTLFGRLKIREHGNGYMHFRSVYEASYYQQLTAEEVRVKHNSKGFPVREWFKKSESARNEVLDCWIYALAAFISLGVNLEQLAEIMNGTHVSNDNQRRVRGSLQAA